MRRRVTAYPASGCYNRCPVDLPPDRMPEPVTEAAASASPPARKAVPPDDRERRRRWLLVVVLIALAGAIALVWIDARNSQRELRLEAAKRLAEVEAGKATLRAGLKEAQ